MKDIIIASANQNKIIEVKTILAPLGFRIRSMRETGIEIDIQEDGNSFEENALIKAWTLADLTKEIVLADDSGLEVEMLNNAPGIYSARYAGEHGNDQRNNLKLLKELKDVPWEKRGAQFVCAIAMVYPHGKEIVTIGECKGIIALEPAGTNGFGYDPLFYIPQLDKTYAQLSSKEKNRISHRSKALRNLKSLLLDKNEEAGN